MGLIVLHDEHPPSVNSSFTGLPEHGVFVVVGWGRVSSTRPFRLGGPARASLRFAADAAVAFAVSLRRCSGLLSSQRSFLAAAHVRRRTSARRFPCRRFPAIGRLLRVGRERQII
jgi:hypothetical protein